jgi:quinoprotein dehydrogenase-associated probable ABC transporter substrate-binding protein
VTFTGRTAPTVDAAFVPQPQPTGSSIRRGSRHEEFNIVPIRRLVVRIAAGLLGWAMAALPVAANPPVTKAPTPGVLRVCADPNNLPFSNRAREGFENELARLLAHDLGWSLEYEWWPQRRGFIRNTLSARKCDVVLGLPTGYELAELTEPYYTSTYVFVTRRDDRLGLSTFDDPRLRRLRIGLHTIGDDYAGVPPAQALARRGIVDNVVGYSIYGDYSRPDPPRDLIDAVARGDVDVAIAWGPLAGYFAGRAPVPLVVSPIEAATDRTGEDPLHFSIAVGVRKGDAALRRALQSVLERRQPEVQQLLTAYEVPVVATPPARKVADVSRRPGPAGHVFVTNERSGELSVIDPQSRSVVATVALGKRPRGMGLSPDGRRLYVALSGSPIAGPNVDESTLPPADKSADGIGVVDLGSLRLLRTIRGVSDPEQVSVSRDGRRLYVASEDTGTAVVLDESDGRLLATLPVGHEPEGIATSPDGRWVYVTSEADDQVAVIDTRSNAVVAQVAVGARPRSIVFATGAPLAYVSCENDASVAVLDTTRHVESARIAIPGAGARPMGLALSPDGATLYVTTGRGGHLVAVDTKTHRVRGSVKVGTRPWGVTVSADGRWLYTANGPSNDVSVVDARSLEVVDTVPVGASPWGTLAHDGSAPAPSLDADEPTGERTAR